MFGGMSYGSVSLNVHRSLAMAAKELGTFMNTGEGGLHADLRALPGPHHRPVRLGPLRRARRVPAGRRRRRDQDRPGRQARHRRAPARREDRRRGLRHPHDPAGHRRPLAGAAPRHLLHRGPAPADLRPQGGHRLQADLGEDRLRAQRRRHRLRHRAGRRRHRLPRRLPRRHRAPRPRSSATTWASPSRSPSPSVDQRLRDEGIRNRASIVAAGGIRSSADVAKAIALGADACAIGTAALVALGCHVCQKCYTGALLLGHLHAAAGPDPPARPGVGRRARWSTWCTPGATSSPRSWARWASTPSRACAAAASGCARSAWTRPPWTSSASSPPAWATERREAA